MTALALIGLVSSIVDEITGTVSRRTVSIGRKVRWIGVGGGYVFAFAMLSVALAQRLPLGVACGIGAAAGVAIIAVLSRIFFKDPLTWVMCLGLALIVDGVLLIELGSAH